MTVSLLLLALELKLLTVKSISVIDCKQVILFHGLFVNHLPFREIRSIKYCSGTLTFNSKMTIFFSLDMAITGLWQTALELLRYVRHVELIRGMMTKTN